MSKTGSQRTSFGGKGFERIRERTYAVGSGKTEFAKTRGGELGYSASDQNELKQTGVAAGGEKVVLGKGRRTAREGRERRAGETAGRRRDGRENEATPNIVKSRAEGGGKQKHGGDLKMGDAEGRREK